MIQTDMARTILICALCLALSLLGISGVHAHLPAVGDPSHAHPHAADHAHAHGGAELAWIIDADHFHSHDVDGDIDIDPTTKAFGKLLLLKIFAAVAFVLGLVELFRRVSGPRTRLALPERPRKSRLRLFLHPPSQAPPHTVFQR